MRVIKDLRIVITGASSGIGKATALALAGYRSKLLLIARDQKRLNEVSSEIATLFPECPQPIVFPCDVSKDDQVKKIINFCTSEFGGVDVLINNAGSGIYGSSELVSMEDIQNIMDVNFYGPLRCTYGLLHLLKQSTNGHIINTASVAALYGIPYLGAYSASKAALASINQSLRAELFDTDIKISIIYPGYTDTEFFAKEKKVGDAVRPDKPYMSPNLVADTIVNTILNGSSDKVLTLEGRLLFILKDILPGLIQNIMKRIAIRLRS